MTLEFKRRGKRIESAEKLLPGRYKGKRKRAERKIRPECPCGWQGRMTSPKKAEVAYQRHLAEKHGDEDLRKV
jgi:hypothetical protein